MQLHLQIFLDLETLTLNLRNLFQEKGSNREEETAIEREHGQVTLKEIQIIQKSQAQRQTQKEAQRQVYFHCKSSFHTFPRHGSSGKAFHGMHTLNCDVFLRGCFLYSS